MRLFQQKQAIRDTGQNRQVAANENEVIDGAAKLDPKDQSDRADYVREAAADIKARRAAAN
jgi:hypothetical protein